MTEAEINRIAQNFPDITLHELRTLRTQMNTTWLDKHQAAELLKCHPGSLPRYRSNSSCGWIEGCHWTRISNQKVLYNQELLQDWLANRNDIDAHLRAIELFQASLPSNQKRSRRKAG